MHSVPEPRDPAAYESKGAVLSAAAPCTRRAAGRDNRRQAILDVAHASFLEHGYSGTSMSQLALVLGGSKSTLWGYFPSKNVLFESVVSRAALDFYGQFSSILSPDGEVGTVLCNFTHEFLRKITAPSSLAFERLVISEVGRFPEIGAIFYDKAAGKSRMILSAYLEGAMQRGQLRQAEPMVAAQDLFAICKAGCHQQLLYGLITAASPATIDHEASRSVATFLQAYGTMPATAL